MFLKRKRLIFIILIVLLSIFGVCIFFDFWKNETSFNKGSEKTIEEPVFDQEWMKVMELDIENESEYNNFSFDLNTQKFDSDNLKEVECTIVNNNLGKGFYFYQIPYIEYREKNKWLQLDYQPPEINQEANWWYCGEEGNKTKANKTQIYFKPEYLRHELLSGDYRLVIFLGLKVFYVPFEVI